MIIDNENIQIGDFVKSYGYDFYGDCIRFDRTDFEILEVTEELLIEINKNRDLSFYEKTENPNK